MINFYKCPPESGDGDACQICIKFCKFEFFSRIVIFLYYLYKIYLINVSKYCVKIDDVLFYAKNLK